MGLVLIHLALGRLHLGVHGGYMLVDIVFGRAATKAERTCGDGDDGGLEYLHWYSLFWSP